MNIHSWQWIWLNNDAFAKVGTDVPANWDEFVAAAPALREAGVAPLAVGSQSWQQAGAITEVLAVAIAGPEAWEQVNIQKDADVAAGQPTLLCSKQPQPRVSCRKTSPFLTGTSQQPQ